MTWRACDDVFVLKGQDFNPAVIPAMFIGTGAQLLNQTPIRADGVLSPERLMPIDPHLMPTS